MRILGISNKGINRIADELYIGDSECMSLGDGGICNAALSGGFYVVVNVNIVSNEYVPFDKKRRAVKSGDVCPFAGEPPDPTDRHCQFYESK